ncbi:uncharacterized protein LOC114644336 [Erpetoichthys calabaricus]|uniref:Uncharacterized LOC114644336 n=1 Tax=Erpetoichthys calabaricus TaxID=27687 RepID=A0A8C4SYP5_ERPCA|nr:uncharacterized protein LOC114644336 [Erpetoichthys calabaricus]
MRILTLSLLLFNAFKKTEATPTTGGNAKGNPCVFPFVYQGKSYSYCITYNDDQMLPWCATTSNFDEDIQWGYCPKSGIKAVNGRAGPECVFPFVYKGKWYFTCTNEDRDKKWCAVTSNYDEDQKWAYCSNASLPAVGGNANGAPCVFPFIYQGQTYTSCINETFEGLWCAATSNYDKDTQWSTCPGAAVPSCAFPFTYQNKEYNFCTTANWNVGRPWCSLNTQYDNKWTHCPTSGVQTFSGNAERPDCVFPFIYKGVTYNSCTNVDSHEDWCSITTNYDQEKLWGYCETKSEFRTTGGNANGAPCAFPFTYKGKPYKHCITYDENRQLPWCSTTRNYDEDKLWGYCPTSGIKAVNGTAGPQCVFPFVYKGKWYFTCTQEDSDKKWCSVTSDYDRDGKWAYCADVALPIVEGNAHGAPCVFPFKYDGQTYTSCINKDYNGLWCATTSDYAKDNRWSTCPGADVPFCAFPFTYKNEDYKFCTTNNWVQGRPWCSLDSTYNNRWKYCPTSGVQTFGGTADRPECVFPFIYKNVTYNSCTKVASSQEWCSITTNYDEDKLWGYCTTEGKKN